VECQNLRDCQELVLFNSRHIGDFLVAGVARVKVWHKKQFSSSYAVWSELA
jgi:hypothetical protein